MPRSISALTTRPGRASHTQVTIPVRPVAGFIGIKPGFDAAIDAGGEAGFDIAAVDRDGKRVAMAAKLRLVRERPDWRLVMRGSLARYETVYRDEPIVAQDVAIPLQGTLHFAQRLDFGRYRLEVLEKGGLAASSVHFRAGWVASDSPDTPDKVDVSTDKQNYRPGESVKLHIAAPFAGHATLLALTDRVQSLRTLDVPEGGTTVELPADAAWGPRRLPDRPRLPRRRDHQGRPRHRPGLGRHRPERAHPVTRHRRPRHAAPADVHQGRDQDGAGCLADLGRRRRGHPPPDQLQDARPGQPLSRPPPARHRHPRTIGAA